MNNIKRICLLILFATILSSCCKMPTFVGKTIVSRNMWRCELEFLSDSTVSYVRMYGWGAPMQEALAKWEFVDKKHLRLTTDFTHQNLPINVVEKQIKSDSLVFILLDGDDDDISLWLSIGDKKYKFDGQRLALSRSDITDLRSFRIIAEANTDRFAPTLNSDQVQTEVYVINNNANNIFEINFPSTKYGLVIPLFYYQELDHILKIQRCGKKLTWMNPGPYWNRHL